MTEHSDLSTIESSPIDSTEIVELLPEGNPMESIPTEPATQGTAESPEEDFFHHIAGWE